MTLVRIALVGLAAALGVGLGAASVGAQTTHGLVKMTEHVLDTKQDFETWCEKEHKGRIEHQSVGSTSTIGCRWKDSLKRELLVVRIVNARRVDDRNADCIAIHYPKELYSRVETELLAKFGAKKRSIVSADGVASKGWFVVLDGKQGAVSNLKKDDHGIVYGCLTKIR